MTNFLRILHLEDNPSDAELLKAILSSDGIACEMERVETRHDFHAALNRGGYDLIISDYSMPSFDGLSALALVQQECPEIPFMFVSGTIGEEVAIESLKHGARDYVLKNRLSHLGAKIRRTLREAREHNIRRQTEAALRDSEKLFRSVWNNSRDGMRISDKYGMIVAVNEAYCRMTGMSASELTGNAFHITELTGTHHADLLDEYIARFADRTVPAHEQRRATFRNGKELAVEISHVFIEAGESEPLLLSIFRDRTEHSQTEQSIRQQAALLDKSQDAIWAMDAAERIFYWNTSAAQLFGWQALEVLGKSPRPLLFTEADDETAARRETIEKTGAWTGELEFSKKNGQRLTVESRWTRITDSESGSGTVLVVNRDNSEKNELQAQFLHAQKLESIGTLACGIAHDINNTLSPILLVTHMLRERLTAPDDLKLLNVLETSAQRGADMVTRVLSFARGAAGESKLIPLPGLIAELEKMARATFPRTVAIHSHLPVNLWQIRGDAGQLQQVLLNLLVNARDAMPAGGTLNLEAANVVLDEAAARRHPGASSGNFVMLLIEDSGIGIAPEFLHKIFDPFFTTKTMGKGTGLGLSAVLGLVKGHGGFITVDSERGRGSKFRVYLPAQPVEAARLLRDSSPRLAEPSGEWILVVEDEDLVREVMQQSLEFFNYRVLAAANGEEALSLYNTHRHEIKLVLTDMTMPVMDGAALIRAIRKQDSEIGIVAISGVAIKPNQFQNPDMKIQAFLAKPFPTERLVSTIRGLIPATAPVRCP